MSRLNSIQDTMNENIEKINLEMEELKKMKDSFENKVALQYVRKEALIDLIKKAGLYDEVLKNHQGTICI